MDIINTIKSLSKKYHKDIIDIRRHLHKNPELSFKEFKTVDFIKKTLENYGIKSSNIKKVTNTGLEVILKGTKSPSNTVIALRADIDALPIQENPPSVYNKFIKNISKILSIYPNNEKVISLKKGVMHACGHDAHTASLIGVIIILNDIKSKFSGTIKFVFQPGEEQLPGGASIMIDEGILQNPSPQCIIGQHVMPNIKVGKVGFCKGVFTASSDRITLLVTIKDGFINKDQLINKDGFINKDQLINKDGFINEDDLTNKNQLINKDGFITQTPFNRKKEKIDFKIPSSTCTNPIIVASNIIVSLQQTISNMKPPLVASVLSFGTVQFNKKDLSVFIGGTLRSMDEKWRKQAHSIISNMAKKIAEAANASCNITITKSYPCLINNHKLTQKIFEYSKKYLPQKNVIEIEPQMFAEDFAYYTQKIPGCFYGLGVANSMKGINSGLHTPSFDIDENALKISMGLMSWIAINVLSLREPYKTKMCQA